MKLSNEFETYLNHMNETGIGMIDAVVQFSLKYNIEIESLGDYIRKRPSLKVLINNDAKRLKMVK